MKAKKVQKGVNTKDAGAALYNKETGFCKICYIM